MHNQINASDLATYAHQSPDSMGQKIWNLFLVVTCFFYLPFLLVWFVFLRYVVTAYGCALVHGYSLTDAWSNFFSRRPHQTLSDEASAFMEKADAIVLFPITLVGWIIDNTIGVEIIGMGIAAILAIAVFSLLFWTIPFKLFKFFQAIIRNTLDK